MEELRKEFSWVREIFEKDAIKVSLEHNSYAKEVFNSNDNIKKLDYFLELFMGSLLLSKRIEMPKLRGLGHQCSECGEFIVYEYNMTTNELLDYVRNKETEELERGKCTFIGDYSFEIAFPTGVIICDDRLPYSSDMLNDIDETKHTLNSNIGLKERTLAHATKNIFHVFVGNSCPDVFKKDDLLCVGHSDDNEGGNCSCGREECDCEYEEYPPVEGAIQIADICTDLWWTSIVDVSIYEKLLIDYYGEEQAKAYMEELNPIKTNIKPGIYKCTYFRNDDIHDRPNIYANLEWVRNI